MANQLDLYAQAMVMDDMTGKPMARVQVATNGTVLAEQKTHADAQTGVVTFSENIRFVKIDNLDTTNDGTFTVNGIDIFVPAGNSVTFEVSGTPGKDVTVKDATEYIISRLV